MSQSQFNLDAYMAAHKEKVAKAEADSKAKADAWMKDDNVARSKGNTPEHAEARKRVARLFCEIHIPDEKPPERDARLAVIDYTQPVTTTNARGKDLTGGAAGGILGLGRKPAYILSVRFPPKTPEDPIYSVEYYPLKR